MHARADGPDVTPHADGAHLDGGHVDRNRNAHLRAELPQKTLHHSTHEHGKDPCQEQPAEDREAQDEDVPTVADITTDILRQRHHHAAIIPPIAVHRRAQLLHVHLDEDQQDGQRCPRPSIVHHPCLDLCKLRVLGRVHHTEGADREEGGRQRDEHPIGHGGEEEPFRLIRGPHGAFRMEEVEVEQQLLQENGDLVEDVRAGQVQSSDRVEGLKDA
mmetsp:Transcript_60518/g.174590  ORF Transcript_60518/g.174590 Transcript_60518/m.174590 type:complete len:216 (-) Transcript_60518:2820-3467(-)